MPVMKRFTLFCLTLCLLVSGCSAPVVTLTQQNITQNRLIGPLTQALDAALAASQTSRTTDEAEQKAKTRFYSELANLLNQSLSSKNAQLQVQAQLTPQGQIQIQAQAQISDQQLTAQAQRQILFKPKS